MKFLPRFMVTLGTATLALGAIAGPLQRGDLPADPAWVLHVDCDALRPTSIGQFLLAEMAKPEAESKFAAFQLMFSFDPRTALHGITLYSTGAAPEDGILIVYADFDPGRLTTLAKAARDYQTTSHRIHTIHNWIDDKKMKKDGGAPRTYAAVHGNRVVFGQKQERVAQTLDAMDRISPNLAGTTAFADLGSAGGTFLQAAARKLELPASDPNAAVFRLSKQLGLVVSESQKTVSATLTMEASDEEVASHINSIAAGLISLMKLQKEKPEAVKFAEALALRQAGAKVVVSAALPASDIIEGMKADAARKAARKGGN
jgi:hypothetical protein